jgi:uncharacterized BrkB/YihY/UPF0761 family membrane protein
MTQTEQQSKNIWQRLDGPFKVGLVFAVLAIVLTIVGIFRDPTTPVTAWSLGVGSLISGVTWGLVSWAIATAAVEVENDVAQAEAEVQADLKSE